MIALDADRISEVLADCGLQHRSVAALATGGFRVTVCRGAWDSASWSYECLAKAAERLGTTNINFQWEEGWGGTEVTPGDPAEFWVLIDAPVTPSEATAVAVAKATREAERRSR